MRCRRGGSGTSLGGMVDVVIVVALLGVLVAVTLVLPAVSTAVGARRRAASWPLAVVAGVFFPATWVVWHLADRPAHRSV